MRLITEIFKSADYIAVSEYLKKADRWDLAEKLIDLIGAVITLQYENNLEILNNKK